MPLHLHHATGGRRANTAARVSYRSSSVFRMPTVASPLAPGSIPRQAHRRAMEPPRGIRPARRRPSCWMIRASLERDCGAVAHRTRSPPKVLLPLDVEALHCIHDEIRRILAAFLHVEHFLEVLNAEEQDHLLLLAPHGIPLDMRRGVRRRS